MKYLLRYGELGLKSSRVRGAMKTKLTTHIAHLFKASEGKVSFSEEGGRLFLESEDEKAPHYLKKAFGLVSFSPVAETSATREDIVELAVALAKTWGTGALTFAVRARRVGEHAYTSMELASDVGSAVQKAYPRREVDLDNPDHEIFIEVRGEKAYLFSEVTDGPGGLPLGTQGKVVALVEEPEGVMASWLMMKRGCWVVPVHRGGANWAGALANWDPEVRPQSMEDVSGMSAVAQAVGAIGYVYPWASEVRQNDERPAFYPLLGLPSKELELLRRRVLSSLEAEKATSPGSSENEERV